MSIEFELAMRSKHGPYFSALHSELAHALHNARGQHICGNTVPPTCMVEEADRLMRKVDKLLDMKSQQEFLGWLASEEQREGYYDD